MLYHCKKEMIVLYAFTALSQNVVSAIILIASPTPTCERTVKEAIKNVVLVAHLIAKLLSKFF